MSNGSFEGVGGPEMAKILAEQLRSMLSSHGPDSHSTKELYELCKSDSEKLRQKGDELSRQGQTEKAAKYIAASKTLNDSIAYFEGATGITPTTEAQGDDEGHRSRKHDDGQNMKGKSRRSKGGGKSTKTSKKGKLSRRESGGGGNVWDDTRSADEVFASATNDSAVFDSAQRAMSDISDGGWATGKDDNDDFGYSLTVDKSSSRKHEGKSSRRSKHKKEFDERSIGVEDVRKGDHFTDGPACVEVNLKQVSGVRAGEKYFVEVSFKENGPFGLDALPGGRTARTSPQSASLDGVCEWGGEVVSINVPIFVGTYKSLKASGGDASGGDLMSNIQVNAQVIEKRSKSTVGSHSVPLLQLIKGPPLPRSLSLISNPPSKSSSLKRLDATFDLIEAMPSGGDGEEHKAHRQSGSGVWWEDNDGKQGSRVNGSEARRTSMESHKSGEGGGSSKLKQRAEKGEENAKEWKHACEQSEHRVTQLKQANMHIQMQMRQMNNQNQQLQAFLTEAQRRGAALEETQQRLAERERQYAVKIEELNKSEAQLSETRTELNKAKRERQEADERSKDLSALLTDTRMRLFAQRSRCVKLHDDLRDHLTTSQQAQSDLSDTRAMNNELREKILYWQTLTQVIKAGDGLGDSVSIGSSYHLLAAQQRDIAATPFYSVDPAVYQSTRSSPRSARSHQSSRRTLRSSRLSHKREREVSDLTHMTPDYPDEMFASRSRYTSDVPSDSDEDVSELSDSPFSPRSPRVMSSDELLHASSSPQHRHVSEVSEFYSHQSHPPQSKRYDDGWGDDSSPSPPPPTSSRGRNEQDAPGADVRGNCFIPTSKDDWNNTERWQGIPYWPPQRSPRPTNEMSVLIDLYRNCVVKGTGVLYEDDAAVVQWRCSPYVRKRGKRCDFTLSVVNKLNGSLNDLDVRLNNTYLLGLKSSLRCLHDSTSIPPMGTVHYKGSSSATAPFAELLTSELTYRHPDNTQQHITLRIPVLVTTFMRPLTVTAREFFKLWATESFQRNSFTKAFPCMKSVRDVGGYRWLASHVTFGGALEVIGGVDPSLTTVVAAGLLSRSDVSDERGGESRGKGSRGKIEGIDVPVLVRVECTGDEGAGEEREVMVRVTVRSNSVIMTKAIMNGLVDLIAGGHVEHHFTRIATLSKTEANDNHNRLQHRLMTTSPSTLYPQFTALGTDSIHSSGPLTSLNALHAIKSASNSVQRKPPADSISPYSSSTQMTHQTDSTHPTLRYGSWKTPQTTPAGFSSVASGVAWR
eukprot:GHVN01055133.1.p1 GENE.GHVN01055133.1~~GHVN01055133.1.p1  ORF type:complete len:1257 (+),score=334.24 GHVN01055133.1:71-3841(+)